MLLRRGTILVTEWIGAGAVARVLLPGCPLDDKPRHVWADLASARGATMYPLGPGIDMWVEPRGGHLRVEDQADPDERDVVLVHARAELDAASEQVGALQRGDGVQLAEIQGRFARLVHTTCITSADYCPHGGWVDLCDESGWSQFHVRYPGEIHPVHQAQLAFAEAQAGIDAEVKAEGERDRLEREAEWAAADEKRRARQAGEEDLFADVASEGQSELPALLWQLGELEAKSIWTRDWREHVDPIWGQRYFVNKWSGQIVHRLASMGVACPAVRLTVCFSNVSFEGLRADSQDEEEAARRIENVRKCLDEPFASLADVDQDRMELVIEEGAGASQDDLEDSIMSSLARDSADRGSFRVVVTIRAPGARSSWASGALKQAMADADGFMLSMIALISNVPDFMAMRVDPYGEVTMVKADLVELDIPRLAKAFEPPPPPPPPPPLPVAEEFAEIRRSYHWTKQSMLHFHCKPMGLGDSQALAEGLENSLPEPPLEELGMWGCKIGDGGTFAIAKALDAGVGRNLQTLLLDENCISAAGARALGAGLKWCGKLRELGVSKNPIGKGFAHLLSGISPGLVILDASETEVDDAGAAAVAAKLRQWPLLRSLKLFHNSLIGPMGCEAIARALLGAPSLKLADLKGANHGGEWPRLQKLLRDGGVDPVRMRVM